MSSSTPSPFPLPVPIQGLSFNLFISFPHCMSCPIQFPSFDFRGTSVSSVLLQSSSFEITSVQRMFRILRKQRLTKVSSLEVTDFISFHVSDPYNNTNLTLLRMMRSLALADILLFFHTARKHYFLFEFTQDILCSCSIFITHTARYVKLSTSSILSPLKVNGSFLCVFIAFVSFTFTTSPVFTGLFVKSSFVCISPCVSDSRHKSRSSSLLTKPH